MRVKSNHRNHLSCTRTNFALGKRLSALVQLLKLYEDIKLWSMCPATSCIKILFVHVRKKSASFFLSAWLFILPFGCFAGLLLSPKENNQQTPRPGRTYIQFVRQFLYSGKCSTMQQGQSNSQ